MENKKTEKDTPKFTAPSMMEAKVSNDQKLECIHNITNESES